LSPAPKNFAAGF